MESPPSIKRYLNFVKIWMYLDPFYSGVAMNDPGKFDPFAPATLAKNVEI
jgi:hypothetical protein